MGVRILHDSDQDLAALYCSTSDVAFGPVFYKDRDTYKGADERAEAFLRWLDSDDATVQWQAYEPNPFIGRRDPRILSDAGLQRAYSDWLAQERAQYLREEAAEAEEDADVVTE